jgi:hypothetical protein
MAKEVPASWLVLLTILRHHDRECASTGDQTAAPSQAGRKAVNFAEAIPVFWSQGITSSSVSRTGIRLWTLMIVSCQDHEPFPP